MLTKSLLENILKNYFKLDETIIKQYSLTAKERKMSLEEYLIVENIITEDGLYKFLAENFQNEYIELKGNDINLDILNIIPEEFAHEHQVVAFKKTEDELDVAMLDPNDIQTIEFFETKNRAFPKSLCYYTQYYQRSPPKIPRQH